MDTLHRCAEAKPVKGTALLASRKRTADRKAAEQKEMQAALKRDGRVCRWPHCEHAAKKLPIDPAHLIAHRGMGGNPKLDRTTQDQIVSLCRKHHGDLDATLIDIDPLTTQGTNGPCAFYLRNKKTLEFEHVASEQRLGVSEVRR